MGRKLLFFNGILLSMALAATPAAAEEGKGLGAVMAPAVLPGGASAAFGFVGLPEIGGGYRQGLDLLEVDGVFRFNYLWVAFAGEGVARFRLPLEAPVEVSPFVGLGLVANTGADYFERLNFPYIGPRLHPGARIVKSVSETVSVLGEFDSTIDFGFAGGARANTLAGGGAEVYLGDQLSVLAVGKLGIDLFKEPFGVTQTRLGYQLLLGVGYRLF